MQNKLITLNEKFSLFSGNGFSNAINSTELPIHRWYFIKEAFSPLLVEKAIQESGLAKTAIILDPFCGSGTVPLVAQTAGFSSLGFEVNPFLAFLSKAKLSRCEISEFLSSSNWIFPYCERGAISNLEGFSTFSPNGKIEKWLFNLDVLRAFTGGWNATKNLSDSSKSILQIALLGAVMDCCNASRDGKALRYKNDWSKINYKKDDFLYALTRRLSFIREDLELQSEKNLGESRIILGDCRKKIKQEFGNFDFCVTSPPYLNSFDYTDIYRPELFLGEFVIKQNDLKLLRFETLRSHVQCKWVKPKMHNFGSRYHDTMKSLSEVESFLWNKNIPFMIQAYFEDMKLLLSNMRKKANPGSKLWLVVSTSAYAGVEIPVDLIIADIGQQVGWVPKEVGLIRKLRSSSQHYETISYGDSSQQLHESVIIFEI